MHYSTNAQLITINGRIKIDQERLATFGKKAKRVVKEFEDFEEQINEEKSSMEKMLRGMDFSAEVKVGDVTRKSFEKDIRGY